LEGRVYWTTESGEDGELTEGRVLSATEAGDDVQTVLDLNAASESEGFINGSSLPTDITIDRTNGMLYVTDQISNNVLAPHVIWSSTLTGDGIDVFDSILACLPGNQSNCQVSDFSAAFSSAYNNVFVLSNTTQIKRVYRIDVESKELRNVLFDAGHDIALLGPEEGLCMSSGAFTGSTLNEFSVWRPDFGTWFVVRQDGAPFVQQWGLPDDVPIAANFNGDSLLDMVVWRPSEGNWYLCDWNGSGACSTTEVVQWGLPGDFPLSGDFDGDGLTDLSVWRPSEGRWYVRDIGTRQWGLPEDVPLTADFNSDERADYVVYRPSTGSWFVLYSSFEGDQPDSSATLIRQWGLPGDHPFAGDYDNDGRPDLVVWRPETGNWFICPSASDYACPTSGTSRQFGLPGDIPVAGDFDADGINDLAVWRPGEGNWYYVASSTGQTSVRQWGLPGDVPTGYSALELDRLN
jgi:hypothetical protein